MRTCVAPHSDRPEAKARLSINTKHVTRHQWRDCDGFVMLCRQWSYQFAKQQQDISIAGLHQTWQNQLHAMEAAAADTGN